MHAGAPVEPPLEPPPLELPPVEPPELEEPAEVELLDELEPEELLEVPARPPLELPPLEELLGEPAPVEELLEVSGGAPQAATAAAATSASTW